MARDTEHTDNTLRGRPLRGRRWHTLPKRSDFLRISASGLRRATPGFILQTAPHTEGSTDPLRVGFTASRKVGNAVARNRAKRRLRALVDKVIPEAGRADHDYVLIGRTETLNRDFAAMERDLRHALKKLGEKKS
jgi:ribonuclease P protein component